MRSVAVAGTRCQRQGQLCRSKATPAAAPRPSRCALRVRSVASPEAPPSKTKAKAPATAPSKAPGGAPSPSPSPTPSPTSSPSSPQYFPGPNDPKWPPQRPFAAIALDNLLESVTDIRRHLDRMGKEKQVADMPPQEQLMPGDKGRMRLRASTKPVLLVLGSGWGAHSLIKVIDTDMYDVVVVSPRNHFLFTPMLPSTAVGTVEFRSLLEPIRTSNPCVTYLEADCNSLDPMSKVAVCTSSFAYDDGRRPEFEVQYDIAVVAVGEQPATFGVPGVREYCHFMKEVTDAVELRKKIAEKFELASLPGTSEEDRRKALSFVVVGGGPTGVEFAGTLSDFLREDLRKKYPQLMRHVKVTLLQSAQSILTQFDMKLGQRALEALESTGVTVRTGVRVTKVTQNQLVLGDGEALDFGVCVWSTGNASRPLVQQIAGAIPAQTEAGKAVGVAPNSKLVVDSFMRVVGAGNLLALGDCTALVTNRLPATAQVAGQQGAYLAHLINSGYMLDEGGYRMPPPYKIVRRGRLQTATDANPLLNWLRTSMMGGQKRMKVRNSVAAAVSALDAPPWVASHTAMTLSTSAGSMGSMDGGSGSDKAERSASNGGAAAAMPLSVPSSAAAAIAAAVEDSDMDVVYFDRPFEFLSLGIMAYVGNAQALTQVEAFDFVNLKLHGSVAFLLWKSVYITKQVSFRNRVLILFDWMKAKVFGRDISLF